ncbi:MAG TPA: uracil phosphoribosyltransferase [Candidatus Saccharimonadales bacterium]|nr:uracil phosphoribosyltransferase [Candidatus Saccharimonadales bacterium]
MVQVLSDKSTIIHSFLRELRDVDLQQDRLRFARNLEMLGSLLGYELSQQLAYKDPRTKTPLGSASTPLPAGGIVIGTVLRAGLPVQRGLQQVFPNADLAFVGAARHEAKDDVSVELGYEAGPDLTDKVLIMADTMLATGHSLVAATKQLVKTHGQPKQIIFTAVIAVQPGIDYVAEHFPEAEIVVCVVDDKLDENFYIVPGLGDAGDLLFGPKL